MISLSFFLYLATIDIMGLAEAFGSALGIGSFAAGILLTLIIFISASSLAIWKKNVMATLIIGILVMSFAIAVSWLSIFTLVLVVFLVALGIADKLTSIISGRV